MKWIDEIRSKPAETRIKIIWSIAGVALVLMVIAWILIGNFHYSSAQKDTSIISALWNGLKKIGH